MRRRRTACRHCERRHAPSSAFGGRLLVLRGRGRGTRRGGALRVRRTVGHAAQALEAFEQDGARVAAVAPLRLEVDGRRLFLEQAEVAGDGVERLGLVVQSDARTLARAAGRDLGDGGAVMRRDLVLGAEPDVVGAAPVEHLADIGEGDAHELEQHAIALHLGAARLARAADADRLGDVGQSLQPPGGVGGVGGCIAGADRRLAADAGDQVLLDEFLLPRTERPPALVIGHGTPWLRCRAPAPEPPLAFLAMAGLRPGERRLPGADDRHSRSGRNRRARRRRSTPARSIGNALCAEGAARVPVLFHTSGGKSRGIGARPDQLDEVATGRYIDGMRAIGLKTLKDKLSEYVRLAAGGETVLVTDRDRVVAELVPPRAGRGEWLADATLAEAVRRGYVTPPALADKTPPPNLPVATLDEILAELAADRDAR